MTFLRTAACACVAASLLTVSPISAQERGGRRSGGPPPTAASNTVTTDPMTGPLVTGAPFSADSATVVTQVLGDGTKIEQRVTAKFYRDTTGRVRREQTIIGLDALDPATQSRTVITFDSVPADPMPYVIDPVARTVRRMPRGSFGAGADPLRLTSSLGDFTIGGGLTFRGRGAGAPDSAGATGASAEANAARLEAARKSLEDLERRLKPEHPDVLRARQAVAQEEANVNMSREVERSINQLTATLNQVAPRQVQTAGSAPIPADVRATEEQIGTRQIEGVRAIGRRTTAIIPINRVGNDQPITITDERWESPELRLVVYSRFSDPRTGVVEYRLTGINRAEPRADLFTVPPDYTVIGGGRGGGTAPAGGRGQPRGGGAPQ
jgi:hypothetical protein